MTLEERRLDIRAAVEIAAELRPLAADKQLRALLLSEIDIGENLFKLLLTRLCSHHALGIERVEMLDGLHPLEHALHEFFVDRFLNERARRAGADLALVEREEDEALNRFIEVGIILIHHIFKE